MNYYKHSGGIFYSTTVIYLNAAPTSSLTMFIAFALFYLRYFLSGVGKLKMANQFQKIA